MNDTAAQQSWLERNWKWLLPVSGGAAVVILISCCGGIVFSIMMMLRGSEVHKMAFERATTDARVIERLGEPIEEGMMVLGQIEYQNSEGHANLQIPIQGPNEKAQINVIAIRSAGVWTIVSLDVQFTDEADRIVIVEER